MGKLHLSRTHIRKSSCDIFILWFYASREFFFNYKNQYCLQCVSKWLKIWRAFSCFLLAFYALLFPRGFTIWGWFKTTQTIGCIFVKYSMRTNDLKLCFCCCIKVPNLFLGLPHKHLPNSKIYRSYKKSWENIMGKLIQIWWKVHGNY